MKGKGSYGGDKANPIQPGNLREKSVKYIEDQCRWWKQGRITDDDMLDALREAERVFAINDRPLWNEDDPRSIFVAGARWHARASEIEAEAEKRYPGGNSPSYLKRKMESGD